MRYVLIGIVILIVLGYLLSRRGRKPVKHRIDVGYGNLKKYIEILLYQGYDRGFLVIEAPDRQRFVQFSKYIGGKKHVGIQFDFPRAPWSSEYFDQLKDLLDQRSFKYEIQRVDPFPDQRPDNHVSEFVVVDLKKDIDGAAELCRLVLLEIFKLKETDLASLWFVNVSPKLERIGF